MSLTIRPPSSRASSSSDGGFRKPAPPAHVNGGGSSLKRAFTAGEDEHDSSDDERPDTELVTSFDQHEARRAATKTEDALVIAALPNRDWRAVANARRTMKQQRGPETGADGSVGGMGTHDRMGDGPQLRGLIKNEPREDRMALMSNVTPSNGAPEPPNSDAQLMKQEPEDEDERARRAILQSLDGSAAEDPNQIGAIAVEGNNDWMLTRNPQNEAEAYKIDVLTRPDSSSVEDYSRVPIEQFGAAMLRGMGWSSDASHDVKPYIPSQRPALLGIGAKERAPDELPGGPNVKVKKTRPDMKYMPLVKKERDGARGDSASSSRASSGSRGPSRSSSPNRRRSPSPSRSSKRRDREDDYGPSSSSDRRRDRDRDRERDADTRDRRDRDDRHRDDRDRDRDRDYDRDRRTGRDRDSKYDDRSDRRRDDRDRDRERERGYDRDRRRD